MSAAHTPGPWAVSYSVDGMSVDTAQPVRFNRTTAGTAVIAHICAHEDAEHFSGEANARLIAAAPNLAHQLLAAANYIDALGGDSRSYRQAYADATGEGA